MAVIDELTAELARLPGIGRKTALRLTFHLLKRPADEIRRLARALESVAESVRACSRCGNLTETDPCSLCTDARRDHGLVCVVEEASDIGAIERTGEYRGLYHVLGGRLSPLDGVGPDDLNISALLGRLGAAAPTAAPGTGALSADRVAEAAPADHYTASVREIIVATNPSVEGEATAVYLQKLIGPLGIRVTRLARGLPVGGDLEYADGVTIAEALSGRRELRGD
ncbi:MAG TPA: recombination mediator RecR [Longimicrobiales bacterium]|nr:recombination mediator RecR [Longimicrobiales bacterium]